MEPTTLGVHADMSFWSLFLQAGFFVKIVMIGLFSASIAVWAVWVAKQRQFAALHKQANAFEDIFWSGAHTLESFARTMAPQQGSHPLASVFVVGLEEWNAATEEERRDGTALQRARRMMDATSRRELEALEAWLPLLATTGAISPFVGLLGTVWGIMTSFQSIGVSKNTSLAVVAPGIAEALFATAIGLFAAIPAVIAYNRLSGSLGRYAARIETFADEFLTVLERQSTKRTSKK
jgi:biopolymer transport protein TolQ